MKAGRELDVLVAEKVFGHVVSRDNTFRIVYDGDDDLVETTTDKSLRRLLAPYSTDIAAAWLVVERMIVDGYEVSEAGYSMATKKWDFTFGNGSSFPGPLCDTAPLAICLAALKAMDCIP